MAESESEGRSLVVHFAEMSDPRAALGVRHSLEAILTIALCALICGADNWVEMEEFGKARAGLVRDVFGPAAWHALA